MLKIALMSNAVFSFTSAMLMLVCGSFLGEYIPLPNWMWMVLGGGLLVFALDLGVLTVAPKWARRFTPWVVVADVSWVLLTTLAALVYWEQLNSTAMLMIVGVNMVVAALAQWQYITHKALA